MTRVPQRHHLSPVLATGDLSYCSASGSCKQVAPGFKFPNGLHLGSDGLLYVPSAAVGDIAVFRPRPDGSVVKVYHIDLDYPIDNLSEDANGDIFAATMPKGIQALAAFNDPLNAPTAPATVWRVRRLNRDVPEKYKYKLSKIIEDGKGEALPGMTTVIHDALTGTLFMSGESLSATSNLFLNAEPLQALCHLLLPFATKSEVVLWNTAEDEVRID